MARCSFRIPVLWTESLRRSRLRGRNEKGQRTGLIVYIGGKGGS